MIMLSDKKKISHVIIPVIKIAVWQNVQYSYFSDSYIDIYNYLLPIFKFIRTRQTSMSIAGETIFQTNLKRTRRGHLSPLSHDAKSLLSSEADITSQPIHSSLKSTDFPTPTCFYQLHQPSSIFQAVRFRFRICFNKYLH